MSQMVQQKDKRSKEQLLQMLGDALQREEALADKVRELEEKAALQARTPRQVFADDALPASKIPFRIDYYRSEENGGLKGLIEHLPTRENLSFSGKGFADIENFITRFLPESAEAPTHAAPPRAQRLADSTVRLILRHADGQPLAGNLPAGAGFRVEMNLKGLGLKRNKSYQATLNLKDLDTGKALHLNEIFHAGDQNELLWPGTPVSLPTGVYRVSASLRALDNDSELFRETALLMVGEAVSVFAS